MARKFDFSTIQKDFEDPLAEGGVCDSCGQPYKSGDRCLCFGYVEHKPRYEGVVWQPKDPGLPTNPLPRAEYKLSIEPDMNKYRQRLTDLWNARPSLAEFVNEFPFDTGTTEELYAAAKILRSLPAVSRYFDNLHATDDMINNYGVRHASVIPDGVPRFDPALNKEVNTDLDYLIKHWFRKSVDSFTRYCSELHRIGKLEKVLVYCSGDRSKGWVAGLDNKPWIVVTEDIDVAHVYLFEPHEFKGTIAHRIKNVWGLAYKGERHNDTRIADVRQKIDGSVVLKVAHSVADTRGAAAYYKEYHMASFTSVKAGCAGGVCAWIPSLKFDLPWTQFTNLPGNSGRHSYLVASRWGETMGIVKTLFIDKFRSSYYAAAGNVHVQIKTPPPSFFPTLHRSISFIDGPADFTQQHFENDRLYEYLPGDEACHFTIIVTKDRTVLYLNSAARSIKKTVYGEHSKPQTYFGWCIMDCYDEIWNPVLYGMAEYFGITDCVPTRLFSLLDLFGAWGSRPPLAGSELTRWGSGMGDAHSPWIINYRRADTWFVSDINWYGPYCRFDRYAYPNAKHYRPPGVGSFVFNEWFSMVGLRRFLDSSGWSDVITSVGGKRDRSWIRAETVPVVVPGFANPYDDL